MSFQCWVTFLVATLNLLSIEQILDRALSALLALKGSPLQGGFMSSLEDALKDPEISKEIAQEFETIASQYITAVIYNILVTFLKLIR